MKAIGYIRVSTEEQASHGISLSTQRDKIINYAHLYDLSLTEIIEDAGESAKSMNRPGLQRALHLMATDQVDGLIVMKLDRLTRSVADWQSLITSYFGEKRGKELFSISDSIDTRTASGRLVLNVLLSVAQWEREIICERTKEQLQHKIRRGERCGKIRFGYTLHEDGKTLLTNVCEQEVIRLIAELKSAGQTLRGIAQELSRRQIPTKEGNPTWTHTAIRRILTR